MKYYFDQVAVAWTTPDPDYLRNLSNPDCISCASLTTTASDLAMKGQRYDRDPASVRNLVFKGAVGSDHVQVTFVLDQKLSHVVDKDGVVVLTDNPKVVERRIELEWVKGQWRVWDIA